MTARKKDPQTLQAKFGFADTDLKTPLHDKIMVWLDENIETAIAQMSKSPRQRVYCPEYIEKRVSDTVAQLRNKQPGQVRRIKELAEMAPAHFSAWEVEGIKWEQPIMSGKYTVGFFDLVATLKTKPCLELSGHTNYRAGYRDLIDELYGDAGFDTVYNETTRVAFEIKTTIPSLGELIRQIQFYRSYEPELSDNYWAHKWVYAVVSPDARWQKQLESQDIHFVRYPSQGGAP